MENTTQTTENKEPVLAEFFGGVVTWQSKTQPPAGIDPNTVDGKISLIKAFCDGIEIIDAATLKVAKAALLKLVSYRTGIDKKRLELKREIDGEAKRITALLAPIEEATRKKVDAEEQKAAEAEKVRKANIDEQMRVAGYRKEHGVFAVGKMIISEDMAYKASAEQLESYITNGLAAKATEEAEAAELAKLREAAAKVPVTPPIAVETTFTTQQHGDTKVNLPAAPDPFAAITSNPVATSSTTVRNDSPLANEAPVHSSQSPYEKGFFDCRNKVLDILKSDAKLTRAQWIERIEQLKA